MLYKKLLVAYDGSDPSKEALKVAANMVGDDEGATLHIISIVPIGSLGVGSGDNIVPASAMQQIFPDMEAYDEAIGNAKQVACDSVREAVDELLPEVACAIDIDAVIAVKPATGICEYAEENGIEMIVMGRRGLGALRAMLGSVSYAVLHETNIPVVTVR